MDRKEAVTILERLAHTEAKWPGTEDTLEALDMAISALSQPNEPLTLEQLREMDEPVWVACKPIEGGNGYWCLCRHGNITTPGGTSFDAAEIPHWVFYRRPPEGEA